MNNKLTEGGRSFIARMQLYELLYKVWCFIGIKGTDKTDNRICAIIYGNFTCKNYRFSITKFMKMKKCLDVWKY